MIKSVDIVS